MAFARFAYCRAAFARFAVGNAGPAPPPPPPPPVVTVDMHDGTVPRHSRYVLDELRRRREERIAHRAELRRELRVRAGLEPPTEPTTEPEQSVPVESVAAEPEPAPEPYRPRYDMRPVQAQIDRVNRELAKINRRLRVAREQEEEQVILAVLGSL